MRRGGQRASAMPRSYALRHSCGKTVSRRFCFASGSNIVHGQSVLP